MKKINIYVVGGDINYANWIPNKVIVNDLKSADIALFTGGEDVCPHLYNEPIGSYTRFNRLRDAREQDAFDNCFLSGKPMLGICRGAQLLCILSGGRLIQDQQNKHFVHPIITRHGEFMITSTHHQAQYPYDMEKNQYKLIGWTEELSDYHHNGEDKEISDKKFKEAEIVWYPYSKALCIQGHPEFSQMKAYPETMDFLISLLNKYLIK